MKQCRFCDAMIPFYGSDTCAKCKKCADDKVIREAKMKEARK
jgi:hypothetical protein